MRFLLLALLINPPAFHRPKPVVTFVETREGSFTATVDCESGWVPDTSAFEDIEWNKKYVRKQLKYVICRRMTADEKKEKKRSDDFWTQFGLQARPITHQFVLKYEPTQ